MNAKVPPEAQALLAQLNSIMQPSEPGFWPLAPGWWLLAVMVVALVAALVVTTITRRRQNAYRRAALAELHTVPPVADAAYAMRVNDLLKRVALQAYPEARAHIARLTGSAWLGFLRSTSDPNGFTNSEAALTQALYNPRTVFDAQSLYTDAEHWLKHHRRAATPKTRMEARRV